MRCRRAECMLSLKWAKYRKYKTYLMEKDGDEKSGCSLFAAEK